LRLEQLEDRTAPSTVAEFHTLTAASQPTGITPGADGNLWFTEFATDRIGRITPAGMVTEFTLVSGSAPLDIVSDGNNNLLYFTESGTGKLATINPLAGSIAAIQSSIIESPVVPSGAGAGLDGITVGPDGNLWFTEVSVDRVGRATPNLVTVNEFSTGIAAGAAPANIVAAPDGALWFTESNFNGGQGAIARITTTGMVTNTFPLTGNNNDPEDITVGPDTNLWFTNAGSDQVGRLVLSTNAIKTFQLPLGSNPQGIVSGPFGALYFAEAGRDLIGQIATTGIIVEQGAGMITTNSQPTDVTVGGSNIWFTEANTSAVGRLTPDAPPTDPAHFPIGFGNGANGVQAVVNLQANGKVVANPSPIPGFTGPITRSTGNFDGSVDAVWAVAGGGGPRIRIISPVNGVIADFFAFAPSFNGGVSVAVADVNGDGKPDLVVGAGSGGGPRVIVIDGTKLTQIQANGQIADSALLASFFANTPAFAGGVNVAAADVNGDGHADVVTGAGPGSGPHVEVINGTKLNQVQANGQIANTALLASFFAVDPNFTGGVNVAAGDFNGDGTPDVIVGEATGGSLVRVRNGTKLNQAQANGEIASWASLGDFQAYAAAFTGGVRVDTVLDATSGKADIVTGAGPGGGPAVKVFRATDLALLDSFFASDPTFAGGVFV
jgi:streptogramin lyase